jgi:tetratricopeptide (TPR) repeat protein
MVRSRATAQQSRYLRTFNATCVLAVVALLTPFLIQGLRGQSTQGQDQDRAYSATLQGSVRDSRGRPVIAATVYLQAKSGTLARTASTDSEGNYRFSALREGAYTLRAEKAGYSEATFDSCVLGRKEEKRIDLTLESARASEPKSASVTTPEFFDGPEFTVAGVTEAANPGGHGSDALLRSAETLERETVSLSKESLSNSHLAPSSAAKEDSLREAVRCEPGNYGANRELGKLLVDRGKAREALPYLERASQLNPSDYENAYELAFAYADAGEYERARTEVQTLATFHHKAGQDLDQSDKAEEHAELHHLLGDIEEKPITLIGGPIF